MKSNSVGTSLRAPVVALALAGVCAGSTARAQTAPGENSGGDTGDVQIGEIEIVAPPPATEPVAPGPPATTPGPYFYSPYQTPVYPYDAVVRATPNRLRYRGGPVPPGWHLHTSRIPVLYIIGSALGALGGVFSFASIASGPGYCYSYTGCRSTDAWVLLPGIGPIISLADGSATNQGALWAAYALVFEGLGLTAAGIGALWRRTHLIRDTPVGPVVMPMSFEHGGGGLAVMGMF